MPSNSIGLTGCLILGIACLGIAGPPCQAQVTDGNLKFDLGPGPVAPGYVKVTPSTLYTKERGFGFEPGSKVVGVDRGGSDPLRDDYCTGDGPFLFSAAVPEGNYEIKLILGDKVGESVTTVKAESRRLMVEAERTSTGTYATPTFLVNVRTPAIASGGMVKLKTREIGVLHWDDKLTLEFNDAHPCVCGIEIKKANNAVTVYLAGDSTVTDQPREPWNSWGQMLPRFFGAGVAVANHAESGETLKSFVGARRLDKILSTIKPGDYLFIQFGHNDQKERGEGVGAFTTYKDSLKRFVAEARKRQALPVLVTPVSRRAFGPDGHVINNLGDYPEAVRQVAKEENVPLIDLNAMSKPFYEALGVEGSKKAFVDNTHHNNYGSYELARCIVEGIKQEKLGLAKFLDPTVKPFDPAHPDPLAEFRVPPSPQASNTVPDGS
jgi:lysophospholipase L1-like esterase